MIWAVPELVIAWLPRRSDQPHHSSGRDIDSDFKMRTKRIAQPQHRRPMRAPRH
jgi:hypothetical protein